VPPPAFDAHRPPDLGLLDDCVHCGYCLPTCPTYDLWGEEMDSPRGRIVLMERAQTEASRLSDVMVTHFDRCLGCLACVTSCPSGVQYDKLIEAVRPQVERNYRRSGGERLWRRLLLELFTHPGRVRATVPLLAVARTLGLTRLGEADRVRQRLPRLAALLSLAPSVPLRSMVGSLPGRRPASAPGGGRVGLLQGCVQRVYFQEVNAATSRVLAAEGFEVVAPRRPRCCGALVQHVGDEEQAVRLAREVIEAFEGVEVVVANAAGCGAALKGYGHLLRDDPEWAERGRAFSAKVRDVSELLATDTPVAPRDPLELKVAYHDACHLAHGQGVREQPRALLRTIPGLELVEVAAWEICCGSAGVYNLLQPEAARDLGRRKAEQVLASGAEVVATGNPGCALQLAAHLRRLGRPLPVVHPVELVGLSIAGRGFPGRS
jgi:glycolate oxidase iron-sulfur subunit